MRPLSVCLSVLSVTLVYCGPTVGWIKMKLGMQVGLGPGHIVLDGDPAPPPPKGHSPQFLAQICCGQMAGWIKIPLGMEVGLDLGDFVLHRDPAPLPKKGAEPPNFGPCLLWHLAWRWASVEATFCWVGTQLPARKRGNSLSAWILLMCCWIWHLRVLAIINRQTTEKLRKFSAFDYTDEVT